MTMRVRMRCAHLLTLVAIILVAFIFFAPLLGLSKFGFAGLAVASLLALYLAFQVFPVTRADYERMLPLRPLQSDADVALADDIIAWLDAQPNLNRELVAYREALHDLLEDAYGE